LRNPTYRYGAHEIKLFLVKDIIFLVKTLTFQHQFLTIYQSYIGKDSVKVVSLLQKETGSSWYECHKMFLIWSI